MRPNQLTSYVEDDRHRLMPCFSKFTIENVDHYSDCSIVTLMIDRRLLLPSTDTVNNLDEAEMKAYWRDSNTPHHIFKAPHIEKLRVVHKFDANQRICEWMWHYEDNDITAIPISSYIDNAYRHLHSFMTTKINDNNRARLQRATDVIRINGDPKECDLLGVEPFIPVEKSKTENFETSQRPKSLSDKLTKS